jgi:flavin-dependent dehydrogenase
MPNLPAHVDCLVVGGGPAGASLAGLLARRGRSVLLVHDGRPRAAAPLETLLPASLPALDRCGLGEAVRAAAEPDPRRHGSRWDDDGLLWQEAGAAGLCVRRPAFDERLRAWAETGGAAIAVGRLRGPLPAAGAGEVSIAFAEGTATVAVRTCALATGRRGIGALVPVAAALVAPPLAAFAFRGRAGAGDAPVAVVEAMADGWCWWIGDRDGGTAVVCVDAAELRARGRRALVDAVLGAAQSPAAALRGAPVAGAIAATARLQSTTANVLLLGDAAATLDPLASQGTEKALVGAEAAACALDLALREPSLHALAIAHHAAWERELWRAHARTAQGFYARVQRFQGAPFWRARQPAPERERALPARLVRAPGVAAATALHRVGDALEPEPAFAQANGEPLARLGRVAIAPLLAAFAAPCAVDAAIARAGQDPQLFICGSAAVRDAVRELWRRGLLVESSNA